jgi:hypothetical protein
MDEPNFGVGPVFIGNGIRGYNRSLFEFETTDKFLGNKWVSGGGLPAPFGVKKHSGFIFIQFENTLYFEEILISLYMFTHQKDKKFGTKCLGNSEKNGRDLRIKSVEIKPTKVIMA